MDFVTRKAKDLAPLDRFRDARGHLREVVKNEPHGALRGYRNVTHVGPTGEPRLDPVGQDCEYQVVPRKGS